MTNLRITRTTRIELALSLVLMKDADLSPTDAFVLSRLEDSGECTCAELLDACTAIPVEEMARILREHIERGLVLVKKR